MEDNAKRIEKYWTLGIYLCVFALFQVLMFLFASWNGCMDHYLGLWFWQMVLGIFGILFVTYKDGNVKLVLYAVMLLGIGQLIQAIAQTGEKYQEYIDGYYKFMIIAIIGGAFLCLLYHKLFGLLYTRIAQVLLGAAILGCFILLKSPLGSWTYGALLWIKIGTFKLQITEFFKPLMVLFLAGLLCRKKKVSFPVLLLSLFSIALVSGLSVVLLNEFGTSLVIGVTGLIIYFVFQNTKTSRIIVGLAAAGLLAIFICYMWGSKMYSTIPLQVSAKVFADEFSACCDKSELVEELQAMTADISKEKLEEQERSMTAMYEKLVVENGLTVRADEAGKIVTYSEICHFLTYVIQDVQVDKAYRSAEELSPVQQEFMTYIQILAEDADFRKMYRDKFIEKRIYANRMLSAYEAQQQTQAGGMVQSLKNLFFENYLPVAEKLQRKFRGFMDPVGQSQDNAYHINQAMSAMSTAGLFGNGPDINKAADGRIFAADSDMVFAMLVSELGSLMGVAVILLNLLIFQEMLFVGLESQTFYQQGICIGMGCCWIVQAFFIIGANCRVFPFAGITLPLISEGGTSLIVSLWMILLVLLISVYPISAKKLRLRKYKADEEEQGQTKQQNKKEKKRNVKELLETLAKKASGLPEDDEEEFDEADAIEDEREEETECTDGSHTRSDDGDVAESNTHKPAATRTARQKESVHKTEDIDNDWKNPLSDM